jgi:hypothetical protein
MSNYPFVAPWSAIPSQDFLKDVLTCRSREAFLVAAAKDGNVAEMQKFVRSKWPKVVSLSDGQHLPTPRARKASRDPEVLAYDGVVHNRELDREDDIISVINIVKFLLTRDNVDEFAQASVYTTSGQDWESAWYKHNATVPNTSWRWYVMSGNHRLIAQHVLGIGPYAFIRVVEKWS